MGSGIHRVGLAAALLAAGVVVASAWSRMSTARTGDVPPVPGRKASGEGLGRIELDPPCPWRDPAGDLARFFPGAVGSTNRLHVLSGVRPEIARRLGRPPSASEHSLPVEEVLRGREVVGRILTRRVKGASGVVELVIALDREGRIAGLSIQRSREPEEVLTRIGGSWLDAFAGRLPTAELPAVPDGTAPGDAAAVTAEAIRDAVRTAGTLLAIAQERERERERAGVAGGGGR